MRRSSSCPSEQEETTSCFCCRPTNGWENEWNDMKHEMGHYCTVKIDMKRIQLCLEQAKRTKFYKELVLYLIFLLLVLISLFSLPIHFPYEQNAALSDLFFEEEFRNISIRKTFHDVMVEDEMWQWMEGPLIEGFYELPIRNIRSISSIMIRSGRVEGQLCRYIHGHTMETLLFPDLNCYPEFSQEKEATDSYGDTSTRDVLGHLYTWTNGLSPLLRSQTFTPSLFNHNMEYGQGGYTIFLPRDNITAARTIVSQLQKDFITDATRYVSISFALYNPRSDLFTHIQALFEVSNTDYMETTARVMSFRILSTLHDTHFIWDNLFIFILVGVTLLLLLREGYDMQESGLIKYLSSLWNLLDLFQLVLLIVFLVQWTLYLILSEKIRQKLVQVVQQDCSGPSNDQYMAQRCFVDVEPLAWQFRAVTNYAAALALVSIAIVFKYLRLNTRLNLLWRTLGLAAKDLIAFVCIFFLIFFAYATMGFLTFGSSVREYHSLSVSLTSCFQMLLGAFDYNTIYDANPAMAGLFFFSFMISIYLICVNMFIAIMSEYYSISQKERKTYEAHLDGTETVEYDIVKQLQTYIHALQIRIRFPSQDDSKHVLLSEHQRVLLVDYDYYIAERQRLKRKLRSYVHVATACSYLFRSIRPEFKMRVIYQELSDSSRNDIVRYVPITSKGANTIAILKSLKAGMWIEMDDGSLTKDQITLEVLGNQNTYLPQQEDEEETVQVRVRSHEDLFGLRHKHPGIGSSHHIRCCRVLYNGETILNGMESCHFPRRVWFTYVLRYVCWESLIRFVSTCCGSKPQPKQRRRLITDTEIDQLITEHFNSPESGGICRYDELVRHFRILIAKKLHLRSFDSKNLEERILMEVIMLLKRFPAALSPLEKRQVEGYKYRPQPTDTTNVRLPNSIFLLAELLAQNAHEVWAVGRIEQGWRWGPSRDNDKRLHPDLVPYEELTEQDKQYDRDTSMEALKVITALGYVLEPPMMGASNENDIEVKFGTKSDQAGETYVPKPIPTDTVTVPRHLRSLIELLAENTHEVWARMRMHQGWKYGPQRDDTKKEHNGLVPYMYLTQEEKQMDRNTALETVKLILRCGYTFIHRDKMSHRSRKRYVSSSASTRAFGRNENSDNTQLGDTVIRAKGASRAKETFLNRNINKANIPSRRSQIELTGYNGGNNYGPSLSTLTTSSTYSEHEESEEIQPRPSISTHDEDGESPAHEVNPSQDQSSE